MTYALGFVRAYAGALGVPAEDAARRFRAEAEQVHGRPALRFPAPVPRQGVPAGALMLLGTVVLAAAYGGWYWVTEHRATLVETVPPIPERLGALGARPAPSPAVASILPSTAPPAIVPPAAPLPLPTTTTTAPPGQTVANQVTTNAPSAPATGAAGVSPHPVATPAPASVTASGPPPPVPPPATQPSGSRIVVKASADAWLTVKQPVGPPVLNKLLHAGDSWTAPADKTGLLLTTGNAGGTEIDVDGAAIPTSLGTSGAVRRDVPLDADLLKAGKLPPAPVKVKRPAATSASG
jgi:cytoskeleton protein RodZ